MAKFCVKCGVPLAGAFCGKCGTDMRSVASPPQPQPSQPTSPQSHVFQPGVQMPPQTLAPAKQPISSLAKLGIAAVAIIFVGGAAGAVGLYYVAHGVSQKIHQAADGILGPGSGSSTPSHREGSGLGRSESGSSAESGTMGNVCRLLSKQDVSRATGVEIIRADPGDNACSYIAKGDEADMLTKHAAAMTASRGADKKTQQMLQTFAGGMFKEFQSERPPSEQDKSGEVPVFNFSVDQHAAEEQMRLNAKGLSVLGDTQGLPGIGDQAFVSGDGMIMVRKGNKLIRIMYITCPCGTEQVKPLAKEIANAL
jgi:hypothetical protein